MSKQAIVRMRARIRGKVHGVFFRASTERRARSLDLAGWVRNRSDGSVELEAEGSREACEALLEYCRKGPPAARVASVEHRWIDPTGTDEGFRARWSVE